jgi:PAS domain S-box-containing protein
MVCVAQATGLSLVLTSFLVYNTGRHLQGRRADMEQDVFNRQIEAAQKRLEALTDGQRKNSAGLWDELSAILEELRAAGEALHRQSEMERERLVAILEATPDMVSTFTVDGRVLYYNRTARRLLGIPSDAGPAEWDIYSGHPDWASEIIQQEGIPTALREGHWEGETAILGRDGREIPVSQVIIAHRDENGEVVYLSAIARDVTEYKRLVANLQEERARAENERRRLEAVMEALPVGVAVTNALGGGLQVNEAYDLVWGDDCQ